jgi:hypothetical protein
MTMTRAAFLALMVWVGTMPVADAAPLLINGNLDVTEAVEIMPDFYLPKPTNWVHEGFLANAGAYEGELTSEAWAGPDPTPVSADGLGGFPPGCGGLDCGVFFKPFSGNAVDGAATGHLYQDVPGVAGRTYTFSGWAGGEANAVAGLEFALDFFDGGSTLISSATLDVVAAGLFVPNGESFNYKPYSLQAVAPAGTATVRARVSMLGGMANADGGGQAIVVDDFDLSDDVRDVPEPAVLALVGAGLLATARRIRTRSVIRT